MDRNHIIMIILVIIIVVLIALIGGFLFMNNAHDDIIVCNNTIEGVGTFNTTNVTNFTFDSEKNGQTHYLAEGPLVAEIITTSRTSIMENTIDDAEKVNDSPKGHTIYKNTAMWVNINVK